MGHYVKINRQKIQFRRRRWLTSLKTTRRTWLSMPTSTATASSETSLCRSRLSSEAKRFFGRLDFSGSVKKIVFCHYLFFWKNFLERQKIQKSGSRHHRRCRRCRCLQRRHRCRCLRRRRRRCRCLRRRRRRRRHCLFLCLKWIDWKFGHRLIHLKVKLSLNNFFYRKSFWS